MAKETANNGWICLHRAMREWQHYDNVFVKAVFIDLLLSATAKPCWSCGIRLTRGQTLRSSRKIEEDNKISRPTVLRALRTLEDSGEIVREKISQKLVKTTIVNYSKYQDINFVSGKNEIPQRLPQRLPQGLPLTTSKQDNNIVDVDKKHTHTHEELIKDLFSREITIEAFCKNEGITTDQCRKYAEAVVIEWQLTDENHNNRTQAIKHLLAQIRIKAQADRERGITFTDKSVRLQPMIDFCRELVADGFNRQDVKDWYGYWTEECQDRTGRMRFEAEKTWNAKRRFSNYLKRKAQ
jgi:hypothetical protein